MDYQLDEICHVTERCYAICLYLEKYFYFCLITTTVSLLRHKICEIFEIS